MHISPSPINHQEAYHIYESFCKLCGGIETFKFNVPGSKIAPFGNILSILVNPIGKSCIFNPMCVNEISGTSAQENIYVEEERKRLVDAFNRICAITRFSYIQGDEEYMRGESSIPFKYTLSGPGLKYDGVYNVSNASHKDEISSISLGPGMDPKFMDEKNLQEFKKNIRFNFQKFHKFESMNIYPALDFMDEIRGHRMLTF